MSPKKSLASAKVAITQPAQNRPNLVQSNNKISPQQQQHRDLSADMSDKANQSLSAPSPQNDADQATTPTITIALNKQQNTSNKNSPTKSLSSQESSPTKSKSKKRNEARKRSAAALNNKKIIVSPATLPSTGQANQGEEVLEMPEHQTPPIQSEIATELPLIQPTQPDAQEPPQTVLVEEDNQVEQQTVDGSSEHLQSISNKPPVTTPSANAGRRPQVSDSISRDRLREIKELKDQLKAHKLHIQNLVADNNAKDNRIKRLESTVSATTRTCNQLEQLLQKELTIKATLESENDGLNQAIARLKSQISNFERTKCNDNEMIRVLNATLMERETEVSILKLKLTRLQTNPSSNIALNSSFSSIKQQDPSQKYLANGRSNSEFNTNSYSRPSTTLMSDSSSVRGSAMQLRGSDRDASVWATVPEELTPSRRPEILEKTFQSVCSEFEATIASLATSNASTPLSRDRRYRTMPHPRRSTPRDLSGASATQQIAINTKTVPTTHSFDDDKTQPAAPCQITNLDESNSTNRSSDNKHSSSNSIINKQLLTDNSTTSNRLQVNKQATTTDNVDEHKSTNAVSENHYSTIDKPDANVGSKPDLNNKKLSEGSTTPKLHARAPSTPVKFSIKKLLDKFRRSDSSTGNSNSRTDLNNDSLSAGTSPFRRGANRSTMIGNSNNIHMTPVRKAMTFQTDKPFAEWNSDMLVDWLTMIGLSMYTAQCKRWVACGAHIMNATPAEVDKGLGITNHLHRKKLRLAISELNGDCDKITKAAAKLDYIWVARWLDDIGLPQYKEAFINARVDGRVLNYLTVEDLLSMGVRSVLHHASIKAGIRVLRSINFDLQLLKRRATANEIEKMNSSLQRLIQNADDVNKAPVHTKQQNQEHIPDLDNSGEPDLRLWTCHRVMEWLRMIDFAEFAPNLRGSGLHGGLIVYESGFTVDTMCSLLSISQSKTLLRRHLSTFFNNLIGDGLAQRKLSHNESPNNQQLNILSEIKVTKKTQWFSKLKSSKVGQDGEADEYLCPMYPVEPSLVRGDKTAPPAVCPKVRDDGMHLPQIPESINV